MPPSAAVLEASRVPRWWKGLGGPPSAQADSAVSAAKTSIETFRPVPMCSPRRANIRGLAPSRNLPCMPPIAAIPKQGQPDCRRRLQGLQAETNRRQMIVERLPVGLQGFVVPDCAAWLDTCPAL